MRVCNRLPEHQGFIHLVLLHRVGLWLDMSSTGQIMNVARVGFDVALRLRYLDLLRPYPQLGTGRSLRWRQGKEDS